MIRMIIKQLIDHNHTSYDKETFVCLEKTPPRLPFEGREALYQRMKQELFEILDKPSPSPSRGEPGKGS
jgi:hypothetical protein